MERKKELVGYETIKGVIFAKYKKQIIEDNGLITEDGIHRSTITSEDYDALKKSKFVDQILLSHDKKISDITVERDELSVIAQKESTDKMIALTRLDAHKEELKHASEVCDEQNKEIENLKVIIDEIYKENQALKADKERLIKDLVSLDERLKGK